MENIETSKAGSKNSSKFKIIDNDIRIVSVSYSSKLHIECILNGSSNIWREKQNQNWNIHWNILVHVIEWTHAQTLKTLQYIYEKKVASNSISRKFSWISFRFGFVLGKNPHQNVSIDQTHHCISFVYIIQCNGVGVILQTLHTETVVIVLKGGGDIQCSTHFR